MADADLVMTGTVLTVDDARPTAEAIAVADGKDILVTGPRLPAWLAPTPGSSIWVPGASCQDLLRHTAIRYWRRSCCRTGSSISVR
ncbi:hypothetical protein J112_02955 [Mycobacterium tuberculosis str. Beijing/NITR203]|nr:hypothetical protein J112_02955 [Mycobacterium tuberculosis str. Beijing/NITR203]